MTKWKLSGRSSQITQDRRSVGLDDGGIAAIVQTSRDHLRDLCLEVVASRSQVHEADIEGLLTRTLGRSFVRDAPGVREIVVPIRPRNVPIGLLTDIAGSVGAIFEEADLLVPFFASTPPESLYPFQEEGIQWLATRRSAILADDMGLGKTVQAILAIASLIRAEGAPAPYLVVAPKSLVLNWVAELYRWAPSLAVSLLMPSKSAASEIWSKRPDRCHVVVTSYEQLRQHQSTISHQSFGGLVADEAHRLRNRHSAISRAFASLSAERRWLLTGTPVEGQARDLATLLSLVNSARFSPDDQGVHPHALRRRAEPYLLRRTKSQVLDELPEHVNLSEAVPMTSEQLHSYRKILLDSRKHPLVKFQELLATCDVDTSSGSSGKLDRILDLLEDLRLEGQRAIVFSHTIDPLRHLGERLKRSRAGLKPLLYTGDLSLTDRESMISQWRRDPNLVLLASLKAAGEGLTLVEANWVLFLNRWWNPSSNDQARDRIRRIGQNRGTFEVSFRSPGTIEDRLYEILEGKRDIIERLTNEDIESLIESESDLDVARDKSDETEVAAPTSAKSLPIPTETTVS